jgi:hypothetical protein
MALLKAPFVANTKLKGDLVSTGNTTQYNAISPPFDRIVLLLGVFLITKNNYVIYK